MRNDMLIHDFEEMVSLGSYEHFAGKRFLTTGATGLIGSLTVKFLLFLNERKRLNLTVYAAVRNEQKAATLFADWESDHLTYINVDFAAQTQEISLDVDYIIHAAAITTSKTMITNPVETMMISVSGTRMMLELARKNNASMVYMSSMEVYGTVDREGKVSESELGFIDLANVRSCYPESKRTCECLCKAYAVQHGVHVMSARLAQTFGVGIQPGENRVFAQFARSAIKGESIVLHTWGRSEGNYVYTGDAVRAILMLLTEGTAGESYNISNEENHLTIAEMAALVAKELSGGKSQVVFDIPEDAAAYGYASDTKLYLSTKKINSLGWYATIGLAEAYRRLAQYITATEFE